MNYKDCITLLQNGYRLVKDTPNKSIRFVNNRSAVQYRTYRKLLFNKVIKSQMYDKYLNMEWFILA